MSTGIGTKLELSAVDTQLPSDMRASWGDGCSEDKAWLMLRRAELGKGWLRWGTLHPEAVCLVEEQDRTAGLWEARAEGHKLQPGTLGEETENFLELSYSMRGTSEAEEPLHALKAGVPTGQMPLPLCS